MKRRSFLQTLTLAGITPFMLSNSLAGKKKSSVQLLRHATLLINIAGVKILLDPMLSTKGEMDPVANAGNDFRNPMVDLPIDQNQLSEIIKEVDAVFVTHTHRDHWDAAAQKLINKDKLIFCQPVDEEKIKAQGFSNVKAIDKSLEWKGLTIHRTGGQHGTGDIAKPMGEVSGFVFSNKNKSIYVAGDTVWCEEVERALETYRPHVTIVNAGGAKFLTSDPITMTPNDIEQVYKKLPSTKIIAVHMETINHCLITREKLSQALTEKSIHKAVLIPKDGEVIAV